MLLLLVTWRTNCTMLADYKDRNEEEYEGMNISLLEEASVQKADAKPVYCTKFLSDWVCSLRNFKWKVVAGIHQALVPNEYSWEEVMGSPIIQYAGEAPNWNSNTCSLIDWLISPPSHWLISLCVYCMHGAGGCSLSACSVCIDRLAFERIHGRGSFAWRVESPPAKLRKECLKRNAWSQESGGKSDRVLDVIIDIGGLPTTDGMALLQIERYRRFVGPYRTTIQMLFSMFEWPCHWGPLGYPKGILRLRCWQGCQEGVQRLPSVLGWQPNGLSACRCMLCIPVFGNPFWPGIAHWSSRQSQC